MYAFHYNVEFNSILFVLLLKLKSQFLKLVASSGLCEELPDRARVRHRLYHHAGFNDDHDHEDYDGDYHDDRDYHDHDYGTMYDGVDEHE